MEVWTIEDGEKRGPFHDFEIRRRIENGELKPDTPAWHEGIDEWTLLGEIPLFSREFDLRHVDEVLPPPLPEPEVPTPVAPDGGGKPSYGRRFWARWFDLVGFMALLWFALWFAGRDIRTVLNNPWFMLFQLVPWFMLEPWLIHRWGRTPGKWLLGIRVVNDDGSNLTLAQASRRSIRVMFIGVGFGWGYISLICHGMSLFFARRLGRPLWDQVGGHRVETSPLHPLGVLAFVAIFWGMLTLYGAVVSPYVAEQLEKQFPKAKEYFEKNPPTHLPKGGPWKKKE